MRDISLLLQLSEQITTCFNKKILLEIDETMFFLIPFLDSKSLNLIIVLKGKPKGINIESYLGITPSNVLLLAKTPVMFTEDSWYVSICID